MILLLNPLVFILSILVLAVNLMSVKCLHGVKVYTSIDRVAFLG